MKDSHRPAAGETFPALVFDTLAHGRVDFAKVEGWRALIVYRGRHCPICKTYLETLNGLLSEFAGAGVAVYAISADPKDRVEVEAKEQGWRFPVGYGLAVDDMRRLGLYISEPRSAEETDRPFAEPGVFVVNPQGRLQVVDISNAPFVRPDLSKLLKGLQFIQAKNYPVRGTA